MGVIDSDRHFNTGGNDPKYKKCELHYCFFRGVNLLCFMQSAILPSPVETIYVVAHNVVLHAMGVDRLFCCFRTHFRTCFTLFFVSSSWWG